jgi:hypothetical protein
MPDWKPLIVSHGFGFTKIDTPLTAVIFMDNLPGAKRDEVLFKAAYRTCKRATCGEVEESKAYKAFESWVRTAGLLLPNVETQLTIAESQSRHIGLATPMVHKAASDAKPAQSGSIG